MGNATEPTPFRFTPEEKAAMKARLMAALKPKPKPQPPTAVERAAERFNPNHKSTEAILQDVTAAAEAVTQRMGEKEWLAEEARKREAALRAWEAQQHRLATDGAQSRNYTRAYQRQMAEVSDPVRNYYARCEEAMAAMRDAEAALRAYPSFHRGPGDPDWRLR